MTRPKFSYEGSYSTPRGLVVCFRTDTGGVPRFDNLLIKVGDLRSDEPDEWQRFLKRERERHEGPPWDQDPLPGIG